MARLKNFAYSLSQVNSDKVLQSSDVTLEDRRKTKILVTLNFLAYLAQISTIGYAILADTDSRWASVLKTNTDPTTPIHLIIEIHYYNWCSILFF